MFPSLQIKCKGQVTLRNVAFTFRSRSVAQFMARVRNPRYGLTLSSAALKLARKRDRKPRIERKLMRSICALFVVLTLLSMALGVIR